MTIAITFLLVLLTSNVVEAIVLGGTNLDLFGYPSHKCYKPIKPLKPYSFSDQFEVDSYNSKVASYNSELMSYLDCLQRYIDNAKNDIERIKEKIKETIDESKY